jgi:hypothetical protein
MRRPMICVHAFNGRPLFLHMGEGSEDKVFLSKKPVVVVIRGQRYEVRETREEIEDFIEEAEET